MTVIAWDGKTLAGDRLASYGGTKVRYKKVSQVTGKDGECWLIGAAGDLAFTHAWREWLRGKAEKPSIPREANFTGLMIDNGLRIWQVEHNLVPYRILAKCHAIGSGRGEALGAMAMGASARKAVLIAQSIDANCGLGVACASFEKATHLQQRR